MSKDIVRVLRVIEYVGPRSWVEKTVEDAIHGRKEMGDGGYVSAATVGGYPEILHGLPEPQRLEVKKPAGVEPFVTVDFSEEDTAWLMYGKKDYSKP